MKLVAHVITALALVAFATPALPCGLEKANKTASQPEAQTSGAVAKADRGEKSQKSVKSEKAKRAEAQKAAATN
jgi:hypothetical protein